MASYIYPSIIHLISGYKCTVLVPILLLKEHLSTGYGKCLVTFSVYHEGQIENQVVREVYFEKGRKIPPNDLFFDVADHDQEWSEPGGFLEISISSVDGDEIFVSQRLVSLYAIYSKQGEKSFFSDVAFRYASPPIIDQVAMYGKYVDTYPITHIDRSKNLGESLVLINPYKMPLVASLITHDGRKTKRVKVPPESTRYIPLEQILLDGENEWMGQIQLTASNRVVTFVMKHAFGDPSKISDHEHMDPFRSDPTHMPWFQLMRNKYGLWRRNSGI